MLKPEKLSDLSPERRQAIMKRSMEDVSAIFAEMRAICVDVSKRGDAVTLERYTKYKADISREDLVVTRAEIDAAYKAIDPKVVDKLKFAAANILKFHLAERERDMWSIEIAPGILAGRVIRPMDIVGCYIPGRRAAYPSSVLMTVIPAKAAGVPRVVACTPPDEGMVVNEASLVAADIAGVDQMFKMGGPWAVGSMAYGTETVPKVNKIVGPGNRYVTASKMAVFGEVDIDSPAGPSEILILADDSANPRWAAIDFLSQIEHDPDAAAVLITPSEKLAKAVCRELKKAMEEVPRREIIEQALRDNSAVLVAGSMAEAIDFTNDYAAEHLEVVTADPISLLPRIRHAGSIFLGPYAPVPAGDYCSGTNHVLPTGQCAKMFSGLSIDDFVKKPTFQYLTRDGLAHLRDAVITLAEAEGLPVHAQTIKERFKE